MVTILQLDGVDKNFGGIEVVRKFDMSVEAGAKVALIGPNGAGKTTIFNLISGVYNVDRGSIVVNGTEVTGMPAFKRIRVGVARSFQNIRLMPHLSVIENVLIGQFDLATNIKSLFRPLHFAAGKADKLRAEEMLGRFNVDVASEEIVSNLPYGLQKRIEVVRALMAEPSLLLLDEPTAGLNSGEADQLSDLLENISSRGVSILLVEHNMRFVNNLVEHAVVMNFGEKIYEGPPRLAQKDSRVREAYLGQDS